MKDQSIDVDCAVQMVSKAIVEEGKIKEKIRKIPKDSFTALDIMTAF